MAMKALVTRVNGEIVAETRNGVRHFHAHDAQGNTIALYDDAGTKTDTYSYWPYGEVRTRTGTTVNPYQYSGAWGCYKNSTGRTYMQARTLRHDLTRWVSVDPLWPLLRERAYVFASSSPTVNIDPTGLKDCKPCPFSDKVPGQLDQDLFRLWADYFFLGKHDLVNQIDSCIQRAARRYGRVCDRFTENHLNCIKQIFVASVDCDCNDCQPSDCACTSGNFPNAHVHICWPSVSLPGCGNYGIGEAPALNLYLTLLHEYLHACNYHHGEGNSKDVTHTCNELAICCLYKVIKKKPTKECF